MDNIKTLANIIDFPPIITRKLHHINYEQSIKPPQNIKFINKSCLFGLEVEIENITNIRIPEYYWNISDDHSLRNNGKEFISIPLRTKQIPYAINYLQNYLNLYNPEYVFSNRCSLHTHLNVRDFTQERICIFLILYCLFEYHFFSIAGTKREHNIFCIPLWKTNQLYNYNILMNNLNIFMDWNKYSAINCGSILGSPDNVKLGTIEFRHLYGTLNTTIIYHWINSILSLREISLKMTLETALNIVNDINNKNSYYDLYKYIFKTYSLDYETITKNFQTILFNLKLNLYEHLSIFYNPIKNPNH